jgi:hypothetical protein
MFRRATQLVNAGHPDMLVMPMRVHRLPGSGARHAASHGHDLSVASATVSDVIDDSEWPPPDLLERVHDLLGDLRAVATALTDPKSGFANNLQLGVAAYSRGPEHAVFMAGSIAARRLHQIDVALNAQGRRPVPFPRERLIENLPRSSAVPDFVDYLETIVNSPLPERDPIDALVKKHGLPGMMMMVQVANEVGRMLAEIDPNIGTLGDLFAKEALGDETEWLTIEKSDETGM